MSEAKKSKEERFLLKLYEAAVARGGPESEVDRYLVGKQVGEQSRGADNTVQMLAKNGLVKKGEEALIYLSSSGINYVLENLI